MGRVLYKTITLFLGVFSGFLWVFLGMVFWFGVWLSFEFTYQLIEDGFFTRHFGG